MKLSAAAITNAKKRQADYKMADGGGLYLLVTKTGSKLWRYDFRLAGKRRTMALGKFPAVTLVAAREMHKNARAAVDEGVDPVQAAKQQSEEAVDDSFRTTALTWWSSQKSGWTERYASSIWNRLEVNVLSKIGDRQMRGLTTNDLLEVLRPIEERGAIEAARRINGYISSVFVTADGLGLVPEGYDPTTKIKKHKLLKKKPRVQHRKAMRAQEMPTFLARLAVSDEEADTRDALMLTLYTVLRTDEIRFAAVEEFEGLNGAEPLWRLPPARMKRHFEHLVPLSRQAVEIVQRRIERVGGRGLLFPRKTVSGTLSENTMLYALYRLGYHSKATVHGFRTTFSTMANEAERVDTAGDAIKMWDGDWIERQLAHVEENEVRGAYNAAEYLPQRRRMLQWWANWLDARAEEGRMLG